MASLPQLIEEDIRQLDRILQELLANSEAATALIIDKGGFLITYTGESEQFDLTTIAALASGAYLANQTIANLVHEENFDSVYQQGEKFSMFVLNVDEYCLLVLIFPAFVSVGARQILCRPFRHRHRPPETRTRQGTRSQRRPRPFRPQSRGHRRRLRQAKEPTWPRRVRQLSRSMEHCSGPCEITPRSTHRENRSAKNTFSKKTLA